LLAVEARLCRHVGLVANDGLDPQLAGIFVKLYRPKHVAVVGHGQHGLLRRDLLDPLQKVFEPGCPVQQAELGMLVQVGKPASPVVGVLRALGIRVGAHYASIIR
jgi:hypothetical protein